MLNDYVESIRLRQTLASILAASITVLCATAPAQAQGVQRSVRRGPDASKMSIEAPLKILMIEAPLPSQPSQPDFRTTRSGVQYYSRPVGSSAPVSSIASRAPASRAPAAPVAPAHFEQMPAIGRAADMSKLGIERPLKRIMSDVPTVAVPTIESTAVLKEIEDKTSGDASSNKVQPGLVTWHKDFAQAKEASAKSGKPVLMFHMMGQLDDRFC